MATETIVRIRTKLKDALNVAINLRAEGKDRDALIYMENVRPFFTDEPIYLRRFHNGLGLTHFNLQEYAEAIIEFREALEVPLTTDESWETLEVAAVHLNLANAFLEVESTSEAHEILSSAETLFREAHEQSWLGETLETSARVYLSEGKYREALDTAKEAVDILWDGLNVKSLGGAIRTLYRAFTAYEQSLVRDTEKALR
jgi:tetratricopeptide (TPR) repeat protein